MKAKSKDISSEIKEVVKTAALFNLKSYGKIKDPKIGPATNFNSMNFDHWIMVILAKSKVINISFQIHFVSSTARKLASAGLGLSYDELNPDICHQFMQEYCNLTVGTIKFHLLETCVKDEDFDLTPSVPLRRPSFDEVNLKNDIHMDNLSDYWTISFENEQIVCATKIEIHDHDSLKKLQPLDISLLLINNGGSVEFL